MLKLNNSTKHPKSSLISMLNKETGKAMDNTCNSRNKIMKCIYNNIIMQVLKLYVDKTNFYLQIAPQDLPLTIRLDYVCRVLMVTLRMKWGLTTVLFVPHLTLKLDLKDQTVLSNVSVSSCFRSSYLAG